jgi:hypothetical protein
MSGPPFSIPESASPTNVTVSGENLCHYITDDQLCRLGEMRKDLVMEICLASGGILAGSLVPALTGWQHWMSTTGASAGDLIAMMMLAASVAAFFITGYQWYVRHQSHVDLVEEIRNRPKVPVRHSV